VLLALGIALGLTVMVWDRVGAGQRDALRATVPATSAAEGQPALPAIPAAGSAVCEANRSALLTAEDAYDAVHGRYADLPTLVAAGLLREPPTTFTIEVAPDGRTFSVHGDCS
jgi:hypothetical protein